MTKFELTIRQVSDLRDFYLKIKKEQEGVSPAATRKRLQKWFAQADYALKKAHPGPSAREVLEKDRDRL